MDLDFRARILAHRGYWKTEDEKNSLVAFDRALDLGFGIETDVRDHGGELVISHDVPVGSCMPFSEFLNLYSAKNATGCLALNIKADGLASRLVQELGNANVKNYFVFDASVPDFIQLAAAGLRSFIRLSDVEADLSLQGQAGGAWLDSMYNEYFPAEKLVWAKDQFEHVAVVSPELHRRPHLDAWNQWRMNVDFAEENTLMLCTDMPEAALQFFGEDND